MKSHTTQHRRDAQVREAELRRVAANDS